MSDGRIVVAMSGDGLLRARAVVTTSIVREATQRQHHTPLAAHALSRALTCAALMPISFKDVDRISLQWVGPGPLRSVLGEVRVAQAGALTVRGFVRVHDAVLPAPLDPRGRHIGRGLRAGSAGGALLTVLTQEPSGRHAQGQVALETGDIDDDLAGYFRDSEQTPTKVRVAVEIDDDGQPRAAVGVLVQALPGADADALDAVRLESLRATDTPRALLARILGDDVQFVDEVPVAYACPCSRARAQSGLAMLDATELMEILDDEGESTVRCEFCGETYRFDADDITALLVEKGRHRGDA